MNKALGLLALFLLAFWFMRSCQRPTENYCMCGG